jgi:hypothetical protein
MAAGRSGRVLVVEGADDKNFFGALAAHMGISDIDIHDVAGRDNFRLEIPTILKMSRDEEIEMIGVVCDAETCAKAAFDSIKSILASAGLTPPPEPGSFSSGSPKTGILIVPDDSDNGMLEDLCLQAPRDSEALRCADIFVGCAMKLRNPPKSPSKARAQAYLAAMPRLVKSVGEGAFGQHWDLDAPALAGVRAFLMRFKQ